MCKYCNTNGEEQVYLCKTESINFGILGKFEFGMYIDNYQNHITAYIDDETSETIESLYSKIKYCPMCGRKLESEEM